MRSPAGRRLLAVAGLALAACAPPATRDAGLEQRLDHLVDSRDPDPAAWHALFAAASGTAWRLRLARGLGQLRQAADRDVLASWLATETDTAVLEELIFAAGQMGDVSTSPQLVSQLDSPHPGLRARAAQALGKLGSRQVSELLLDRLADSKPAVGSAALLALVRLQGRRTGSPATFDEDASQRLLQQIDALAADASGDLQWQAAYALSEIEIGGRDARLRTAAVDGQPLARLFALRGLERLVDPGPGLVAFLAARLDAEENVHAAAAAAAGLARHGVATQPTLPALVRAAGRAEGMADHHVRHAAVEALGKLTVEAGKEPPAPMLKALQGALDDASTMVRLQALESLARQAPQLAAAPIAAWAGASSSRKRRAAARAAAYLAGAMAVPLLDQLLGDADTGVVGEALTARAALAGAPGAAAAARRLLSAGDLAVRGTAITVLGNHGEQADLGALEASYSSAPGSDWVEARVEMVATAAKLAGAAALPFLRRAVTDPSPAVRQAAAAALQAQGETVPLPDAVAGEPSSVPRPDAAIDRGQSRPRVALETTRGDIILELLPEAAPRHVHSFLQRAAAGLHDGLPFHRIVSGFVVQGLDPRGDGWGSGGVFLRDEINPVAYQAGTLGMPNAGPDSAGCQIFITHVPTPHLDGNYTVFGRVVQGMEVVEALDLDDICVRVRRID